MKHNYFPIVLLLLIGTFSCKKSDVEKQCYKDFSGFSIITDTNLIFPFGTENFWIYDDSLKRDSDSSIKLVTNNFLFTARKLYQIENDYYNIEFNQWKSPMTLKNDTIFFSQISTDINNSACYEHKPFLFKTETMSFLNEEKTIMLYPEKGIINTKLGPIEYSYIYYFMPSEKYYINPKIGIIREEILSITGEIIRSKTLNNYYIK